jgi:hypothetical protein
MRLTRDEIPSMPPIRIEEETPEADPVGGSGFMEGFVPGYEMPPGVGLGTTPPRRSERREPKNEPAMAPPAPTVMPHAADPAPVDLSQETLDQVAEMVVRKMADRVVREIAWEVIPSVAEALVRQRIKELEEGT